MSESEKSKEDNYLAIGIGIGLPLGALLGLIIFDNLAIGTGIGLVFGITFGMVFSSSENNEE